MREAVTKRFCQLLPERHWIKGQDAQGRTGCPIRNDNNSDSSCPLLEMSFAGQTGGVLGRPGQWARVRQQGSDPWPHSLPNSWHLNFPICKLQRVTVLSSGSLVDWRSGPVRQVHSHGGYSSEALIMITPASTRRPSPFDRPLQLWQLIAWAPGCEWRWTSWFQKSVMTLCFYFLIW